ncbi:MAG TPA: O-antigen ligase family protein, partial [Planctomycetia bacterium]|nr:O-antigen ligase family protein [Planctomycetia bacterium]
MRSAGSSEERSSPLEYLVPLVLAGLAAIPAWYFGGVSETRFFWPPVLFAASVWIALVGLQLAPRAAMPAALLPLALVFAWVLFQLTPLSPRTLAWWSPTAAAAWSEADGGGGAESGSAGGARRTISLFPEGTREEAALLFLGFAVFALAAHFLRSDRMLPLLFVSTAASGAALGLFAIVQKMQNARKLYFEVDLSMGGVFYGPFVNRNHCAAYLAMCLAGAVAMLAWLDARRRRKEREALRQAGPQAAFFPEAEGWRQQALESFRGFGPWHLTFLFGAAAIGAALMASGSRGAILSAALAAAAVALAWRIPQPDPDDDAERGRSSGFVLAIAAALGAVALAAWTGLDQQAFDRLGSLGEEGDAGQAYRALHWREMAAAIPVFAKAGSGLGTYAVVSPGFTPNNRGRTFEHAENSYLEAIVELGIPGAILLLVTLLLLLRATALLLFNDGGRESRIFALAATFVLISQAAHAAVDFALLSPANLILFAAWMGAAAGRAARLERARAKSGRTPARFISLPASGS